MRLRYVAKKAKETDPDPPAVYRTAVGLQKIEASQGETIEVPDEEGARMLDTFPTWFEEVKGGKG